MTSLRRRSRRLRCQRTPGFTLVELMVTLVIAAILAAIAVPSMREFIARQRVEGVAKELMSDLRYLRSSQLQLNEWVVIRFGDTATTTCYVLYTFGSGFGNCDCTRAAPICTNVGAGSSQELKTVILPRSRGITVAANPVMLQLRGLNAMPNAGNLLQATVQGDIGGTVRVSTNAVMRTEICSVAGHQSSLPACAP